MKNETKKVMKKYEMIFTASVKSLNLESCPALGVGDEYSDLSNLEGIQICDNLEYLNITGSQVADLTPLKGLKNLRILNLTGCKNLTDLIGLPSNLRVLHIWGTSVSSIWSLADQTELEALRLPSGVHDLDPILDLEHLSVLRVN
jgi:Leucine-rich repeat (LRR) protein